MTPNETIWLYSFPIWIIIGIVGLIYGRGLLVAVSVLGLLWNVTMMPVFVLEADCIAEAEKRGIINAGAYCNAPWGSAEEIAIYKNKENK